jgi:hypothetical protein
MKMILSVLTQSDNIKMIIQAKSCLFIIKKVQTNIIIAPNISGVVLLQAISIGEEKVSKYKGKKNKGFSSISFLKIKYKTLQNTKYENIETAKIA